MTFAPITGKKCAAHKTVVLSRVSSRLQKSDAAEEIQKRLEEVEEKLNRLSNLESPSVSGSPRSGKEIPPKSANSEDTTESNFNNAETILPKQAVPQKTMSPINLSVNEE